MKHTDLVRCHSGYAVKTMAESRIERLVFHDKKCTARCDVELELRELREWVARLDSNPHIRTSSFLKRFGSTEEHCMRMFGEYWPKEARVPCDDRIEIYIAKMTEFKKAQTKEARVSELRYRLETELQLACEAGDLVVFNTLTVRNENLRSVFARRSREWDTYMKRWRRTFGKHRYFAVVERGTKNGRLHIHCVHMFRFAGQRGFVDPNEGTGKPDKREIVGLKSFWSAGFSSPIACRFGPDDGFARLGWRWPVVLEGSSWLPLEVKSPLALARYVSKYVLKDITMEKEKSIWRTRMTRGLGLGQLKTIMNHLPTRTLSQVMSNPMLLKVHKDRRLLEMPKRLVEYEATKEWITRVTKRHPILLYKVLKRVTKNMSYVEHLRTLMKTKQDPSLQNTMSTRMKRSRETDISEIKLVTENVFDVTVFNENEVRVNGVCTTRT